MTPGRLRAQTPPSTPPTAASTPSEAQTPAGPNAPAAQADDEETPEGFHWSGTAEFYYQYNLNNPSNGLTAFRYYDQAHNLLSVQNLLLDSRYRYGRVSGHLQLQLGVYPETFYAPARSLELDLLWRLIQEVTLRYRTGIGRGLGVEAGIYVAPYSIEDMAVWQNWNWSYSNIFAAAPFQMAGARVTYPVGAHGVVSGGVYNGWDQINTDETPYKTFLGAFEWEDGDNFFTVQYSAGVERWRGAAEGARPRHTLNAYGQWQLSDRLALRGDLFAGYEPTLLGDAGFAGLALYGRYRLSSWLYTALRVDALHEVIPEGAEYIFLESANTVASGTVTLDARPNEHVSFKLEFRHDESDGDMFFRGDVARDMMTMSWVPNARRQSTLLLGFSTWF